MEPSIDSPEMPTNSNAAPQIRLFSERDFIAGAAVGGVIAPTYFFYKNFKNQGNLKAAKLSVIFGLAAFVVIFGLSFFTETILRTSIPTWIYLPIFIAITKGLVVKFQSASIKQHKESGGQFYKSRAAGVVFVSMIITVLMFLGIVQIVITTTHSNLGIWDTIFLSQQKFDKTALDQRALEINQNDQLSIKVLSLPSTTTNAELISGIDAGIVRYTRNLQLVNEIDGIKNIPEIIKEDSARIRKYTELRIQMFELLKKSVVEETRAYDSQIMSIGKEIEPLTQSQKSK